MPGTTVLIYDYVPDVLERRGPHREEHLAHIDDWAGGGRLAMAGAIGDPPSGALFVFESTDRADVERFAADDPYAAAGLVSESRIEPWALVTQRPPAAEAL